MEQHRIEGLDDERLRMTSAYAELQRLGRLLLRAQGFGVSEERTAAGRRFFLYQRAGSGSGPPILLVHGLGGAATSFASIAGKCARLSRRVLLVDLPGHGLAALENGEKPASALELTDALEKVLERESEPVLLVGNSLGGGLVLGAALLWPEKIAGVVGLAPAGAPFTEEESRQVRSVFRGGAGSGGELGRRLFHAPPLAVRLVARGLGAHIAEPAVQHIVGHIQQGDQSLPQEQLRALRVPVLVLWGDDDQVLPASGAAYFRAALPPGSVEVLEQCGHLPQIEQAGEVLQRLERFVAALPARPVPA